MDSGQPCTSATLPDSSSSSYSTAKKTDCGSEDSSSSAVADSTNNSLENHSKRFIKESKIHLLSDSEDSFEVFLPKKKITSITSKAASKPAGKLKAKKTVSRSRACPYFSSKSTVKSFFKPPPKSQEEKDLELALARSLLDVSGSGGSPLVTEPAPVKPPPPQEPTFTLKNWTGKGTKKLKSQKYILPRRTREERENIITQKLGIVLLAGTESSDETFSKINIELSSSHLQGFYVQNSKLWELSKLSVDCFVSDFYVDSFKTIIDPPSSSEFYDLKNSQPSPQISTSGEPDTDQWTVLEENQQVGDSGRFESMPSVESDHLNISQSVREHMSDPMSSSSSTEENKDPMEPTLKKNISSPPYHGLETVDQTLEDFTENFGESHSQRVDNVPSPSTVNEFNEMSEPNLEKIDTSPPYYVFDRLDSDSSTCFNKEEGELMMSSVKLKEDSSEAETLSQKTMSLDGFQYTKERSKTENFSSSRSRVEPVEEPNITESSPVTKDTCFSTSLESLKILSNDWQSLFKNSTFSDMDFRIDDKLTIPGHKIILHVRCPPLLRELDYQHLSHLSHRDFIDLSIYHKNAVITFLRYLYSGKTDRINSLSEDEKNDLSLLATKYKVSYLDKLLSINSKRELIYDESTCSPPHDSNSSDSCLINDKPKNLDDADIQVVAVDLPCSLSNKKNLSNEDNSEKLRSTSPDLFEISNRSSGSKSTKRKLDFNNETIEIIDDTSSSRIKMSSSSVTNLESIEVIDISNDGPCRRQSPRIKNRKSLTTDVIVLNSDSNESFSADTKTSEKSPGGKIVRDLSHRSINSPEDNLNILVGRLSELPETTGKTFSRKSSLRKDDNCRDTSLTSSVDLNKLKNVSPISSNKDPCVTNKSPSNVTCTSSYSFSKKFSFQEENDSLNLLSTTSFDCKKISDSAVASTSQNSPVLIDSPPKLSSSITADIYDEDTVLKSPVKYFSLKYEKSISTKNVNESSSSSENSLPPPKKKSVEDSLIVLSPDSDDDSKTQKLPQHNNFKDSGIVEKSSLNFPSTSSFDNDFNFNSSDDDNPQTFSPVKKNSSVNYQNSLPSTSFHSPIESCGDTLSKNLRSTLSKVKSVSRDSLYSKKQLSPENFNDYKAKNRNSSLDGYLQSSFPSGSFLDQVESQVPLASTPTSSSTGFPSPLVKDFQVREGHQSTPQNLPSTSRSLEEIKSSTPKDEQHSLIIKDATPRPDFNAMETPELKKGLAKYGLKQNLEPKKAKSLLSYIYDQLHPNIPNQEEDKEDNNENQSEEIVNDVKDCEFVLEETLFNESIAENLPSETTVDPNNLKKIIFNFIKNDTNLHGSVITFQPLLFKDFYKILREQGVKCTVAQLMDTLDELCIVYRVERPERNTKKRKRKVTKT